MAFPDRAKPIATCVAESCASCPVQGRIHCHFRPRDLIHFLPAQSIRCQALAATEQELTALITNTIDCITATC